MTQSIRSPWGTAHELNLVCRPRHCRNLYNDEATQWALALSCLANLIKKKLKAEEIVGRGGGGVSEDRYQVPLSQFLEPKNKRLTRENKRHESER